MRSWFIKEESESICITEGSTGLLNLLSKEDVLDRTTSRALG